MTFVNYFLKDFILTIEKFRLRNILKENLLKKKGNECDINSATKKD